MTRNHSPKSLAVLLRARMHPDALPSPPPQLSPPPPPTDPDPAAQPAASVRHWLHASASTASPPPAALDSFSDGYRALDRGGRGEVLRSLATDYDVPRARVRDLMRQYMSVASAAAAGGDEAEAEAEAEEGKEGAAAALYRMERGLRDALRPQYAAFLEAMNAQPGGLKLLAVLRADLLALLGEENAPALRALDLYLKEKLVTWLSPAALTLHQITWDDPASLLEKIVAYEAVHPIRNLIDLKRRLGVGRRCFGYFHPAIPGEPLIFIEVALHKDMAASIQEVLWDEPPTPEFEASCALFYSISSTQPGLSGINLGKFLLKRVVDMLRRDMPSIQIFATLSPIPGFMQWLRAKLASQIKLAETESQEGSSLEGAGSTFRESILLPNEEKMIHDAIEQAQGKQGIELLQDILKTSEWVKSEKLSAALKSPLMRLCARYLAREKIRGKALDAVANFHLQNGAMIERINWMADQSEKGIQQSGGIMVNYLYRSENIEENALSYSGTGLIYSSPSLSQYLEGGFPGGNSSPYQAAWNPYMYGYQGPPSWFPQGFPQLPPNVPMVHPSTNGPHVFNPAERAEASVENNEADVEELDVPLAPAPTGKDRRKKVVNRVKLGNFNPDEDVNIVKSWLEISCDPITNTGQKRDRLWDRIVQRYNLKRGSYPERSLRSLQSRWDIIKAEVSKFSSFYADAIRENPSGMSDADKTTHAAATFAGILKHNFAFMHCWKIMKDEPKWQGPKPRAFAKAAGGDAFGEDSSHDHDNNDLGHDTNDLGHDNRSPTKSAGKRPMGRDATKAAKKKANSSAGSSSSEYASRMQDLSLQKISILQEESVRKTDRFQQLSCIDEKRFEEMRSHNQSLLEIEQEKIWIMHEKHDMDRQEKEKQEDERILGIDLNVCTPAQRMYYEALQEEIFEKIAARRGKRQAP